MIVENKVLDMKLIIHTKDKNISEICSEYWKIDDKHRFVNKVTELTSKYGVTHAKLLKVVTECCTAYFTDASCSICGEMYQVKNRSDFNTVNKKLDWSCNSCKQELMEMRQKQKADQEKKCRDILQRDYEKNSIKEGSIENLSIREMVYLLSVIRHSAKEDLSYMFPNDSSAELLSPDVEFNAVILGDLYEAGLLTISPRSTLSAVKFKDNKSDLCLPESVTWNFVVFEDAKHPKDVIVRIESLLQSDEFQVKRADEIIDLAKDVILLECLGFLKYAVEKHSLSFSAGEKTRIVLRKVLSEFTVAQAYRFIWNAVKNAAAFYMRENVNIRHAANTIVGSIQNQFDKALAEAWNIYPFRRNYDLPQSVLSQVLFNSCLKTNDGGFDELLGNVFKHSVDVS